MERPTGVTILAVLCFLGAAFLVLAALVFLFGGAMLSQMGTTGVGSLLVGLGAVAGAIFVLFGALYLFIGIGLLGLKNWARILTIVFAGIGLIMAALGLAGALMRVQTGAMVYQAIVAGIDAWILVYLFKPHVKQAFGAP